MQGRATATTAATTMTKHEEKGWWLEPPWAVGRNTREYLDPNLAEEACQEYVQLMQRIGLYEEATLEACLAETGKGPVDTKWVITSTGTREELEIKRRLVARDFRPKGEKLRADLFAATPHQEAIKLLLRMAVGAARRWKGSKRERKKLLLVDMKERT